MAPLSTQRPCLPSRRTAHPCCRDYSTLFPRQPPQALWRVWPPNLTPCEANGPKRQLHANRAPALSRPSQETLPARHCPTPLVRCKRTRSPESRFGASPRRAASVRAARATVAANSVRKESFRMLSTCKTVKIAVKGSDTLHIKFILLGFIFDRKGNPPKSPLNGFCARLCVCAYSGVFCTTAAGEHTSRPAPSCSNTGLAWPPNSARSS